MFKSECIQKLNALFSYNVVVGNEVVQDIDERNLWTFLDICKWGVERRRKNCDGGKGIQWSQSPGLMILFLMFTKLMGFGSLLAVDPVIAIYSRSEARKNDVVLASSMKTGNPWHKAP
ncbi:hypothetical protein POTOM_039005 [Populus tomentosa]|uniref:Uncharacterized protein n=1 Tax=Populus tomentosa TaxID=118781 RepID=A0A8X8CDX9_POPTO|nr:hypothetical protein POTOM_039005 [Populus tomentosa]